MNQTMYIPISPPISENTCMLISSTSDAPHASVATVIKLLGVSKKFKFLFSTFSPIFTVQTIVVVGR